MHKFVIRETEAGFRAYFMYNSEIVWHTETYTSKASAKNAIESIKEHINAEVIDEA